MIKANYHVHSTGSDGKVEPEEIIKHAINVGITHLCFTDHFRRPSETVDGGWNDSKFHNEEYRKTVEALKEKYKDRIDISYGVELDWLESYEDWMKKVLGENKFDYVIGSIHVMKIGGKWEVLDYKKEELIEAARKVGGIQNLIKEYYRQRRFMARSGLFDSAGHLDYVKYFNKDSELFSEDASWYKKEVLDTLDEIKKAGMCIEINTSGWIKKPEQQYPSLWILKEAKKRNIPITIGTDFHGTNAQEKIDTNLDRAYELAREAGYKSILIFKNRKSEEVAI